VYRVRREGGEIDSIRLGASTFRYDAFRCQRGVGVYDNEFAVLEASGFVCCCGIEADKAAE